MTAGTKESNEKIINLSLIIGDCAITQIIKYDEFDDLTQQKEVIRFITKNMTDHILDSEDFSKYIKELK